MSGIAHVGTSGFAYPGWAPRFYPAGIRPADLLSAYAARLTACELNNTYYQQPTEAKVAAWLAATPASFRFAVKAQRGGSYRSLLVDPTAGVPWLTAPLRRFGDRLGTVLFRVPDRTTRDDEKLAALLAAWPRDLPLTVEFQDPSWHVDEVFAMLRDADAALCTTELPDDPDPPTIRRTGRFLYSAFAVTTTGRQSSRRGPRGSNRSSRTGSTPSSSSATTRSGAVASLRWSSQNSWAGSSSRATPRPARRRRGASGPR